MIFLSVVLATSNDLSLVRRAAAYLNLLKIFFRLTNDSTLYKKYVSHKNAIIFFYSKDVSKLMTSTVSAFPWLSSAFRTLVLVTKLKKFDCVQQVGLLHAVFLYVLPLPPRNHIPVLLETYYDKSTCCDDSVQLGLQRRY